MLPRSHHNNVTVSRRKLKKRFNLQAVAKLTAQVNGVIKLESFNQSADWESYTTHAHPAARTVGFRESFFYGR